MTKAEIDAAWRRSSVNDTKETDYHERSLRRHCDHCYKFFGIAIDYDYRQRTYSISPQSSFQQSRLQEWMLNTFSLQQLLDEVKHMSDRVVLEHIPNDLQFVC